MLIHGAISVKHENIFLFKHIHNTTSTEFSFRWESLNTTPYMLHLLPTTSSHPDFLALVSRLDAELKLRDGDDHAFYAQFNTVDTLQYAIVAYVDDIPVGCGALKKYDADIAEIKRMYTLESYRGQGIASMILTALESKAAELGYKCCILETGLNQPEAIGLYHKNGFSRIPNYGQYADVENSVCFEKELTT